MNSIFKNIVTIALLVGVAATSGLAQFQDPNDVPKTNSPLTRFGLGDLSPLGFASIDSYGGLYASYQDAYSANIINPASLPSLLEMAFEVGLYAKNSSFEQGSVQENTWTGNIDYIGIAFPTKNLLNITLDQKIPDFKHGMSVSLSPYSLVGYDILNSSSVVGGNQVTDSFRGKGGTYRFMWGNGFAYKNLSLGLNIGYLFGNIEQQRSLSIADVDFGFATIDYDKINVRGFQYNFGAQYTFKFVTNEEKETGEVKGKNRLVLGLYGNSSTKTNAFIDEVSSRGRPNPTSVGSEFIAIDTLSSTLGREFEGKMPSEFGFGASYYKWDSRTGLPKLKVGVNYSTTGWSEFRLDGRDGNLGDGWTVSTGVEWTPFANAIKYGKRIRYRAGLRIAKDPRFIGTGTQREQLNNVALNLGLGLPLILKRGVSMVNLSFELGKLTSENSINETYGRIGVGFTLNDNSWFLKRKLN